MIPGSDSKEGSNSVSMDEKVHKSFRGINVGLEESSSTSKIIPVNSPHLTINVFDNINKVSLCIGISLDIVGAFFTYTRDFS